MPDPQEQQMFDAINQARMQYPWLKRFGKIAMTKGAGPYQSESYMPDVPNNPKPGNYTVELRSDQIKKNPKGWADLLGREGLDWLSQSDPVFQAAAKQFVASMTPPQRAHSRERWNSEGNDDGTFEDWLHEAEAQEYIGGYLTPKAAPGWTGPKGEGQYTPEQVQLLERLKAHLSQ